ncbi:hypothetical protein K8I61_06675 [bacterium]|nr:hypothetical protein [bacterium]
MLAAVAALLVGMWAGLTRVGVPLSVRPDWIAAHGPLMVAAFLGTLIGMERAAARKALPAYLAPFLTAAGGLLLIAGQANAGALAFAGGGIVFALVSIDLARRHPTLPARIMAGGALFFAAGNIFFAANRPVFDIVPAWSLFLVLTICGERLELARYSRLTRQTTNLFLAALGLAGAAGVAALFKIPGAIAALGAAYAGAGVWLLRYDLARASLRREGLARFVAAALIPGYVWLVAGGLFAIAMGKTTAGPAYDAAWHAIFLGFVFSMVFGHAPIILPGVLKIDLPFAPRFWAHLGLLHASLALRIAADLLAWPAGRQAGAIGNALAILLFFGNTIVSVIRARRAKQR